MTVTFLGVLAVVLYVVLRALQRGHQRDAEERLGMRLRRDAVRLSGCEDVPEPAGWPAAKKKAPLIGTSRYKDEVSR